MKTCSHCKIIRELKFFGKNKNAKDGLASWCNPCRADLERLNRIKKGIKPKLKPKIIGHSKECLKCFKIKNFKNFRKSKRGKLGLASYCFLCEREYHKNLRENNPKKFKDKSKEYTQKYRNKNREHWRGLHRVNQFNRSNKTKAQSDGTVTKDFMIKLYATKKCYWCSKFIPISKRTAEHIIPLDKGGVHGISNLAMACLSCNSSKINFK